MLCLLPGLAGITFFFVIPYVRVLYYSVIGNQFRRNFVGLSHYSKTLTNESFLLGLKNSVLLIVIAVPILIFLSLLLSIPLAYGMKKLRLLRGAFILPMVVPAASAAVLWQAVFGGWDSVVPIYLLFIWKNCGICIILMTAALTCIEDAVFEAAALDGAYGLALHTRITLPIILPTVVFSALLSIVGSFKIFKETYLVYGGANYPPNHSYTLQYFMNNNFLKLDYQSLAAGAVLTSILVFGIVMGGLILQRRVER